MSRAEMGGITDAMMHLDAVQVEARQVAENKITTEVIPEAPYIWDIYRAPSREDVISWKREHNGDIRYMGQSTWSEKQVEGLGQRNVQEIAAEEKPLA